MGDKNNVICNGNEDLIGYHKDIVAYIKSCLKDYVEDDNWEEVQDMANILLDLNGWADNERLLVLSENNGMGWTIKEYEKGDY